jgi:hypothetical protein
VAGCVPSRQPCASSSGSSERSDDRGARPGGSLPAAARGRDRKGRQRSRRSSEPKQTQGARRVVAPGDALLRLAVAPDPPEAAARRDVRRVRVGVTSPCARDARTRLDDVSCPADHRRRLPAGSRTGQADSPGTGTLSSALRVGAAEERVGLAFRGGGPTSGPSTSARRRSTFARRSGVLRRPIGCGPRRTCPPAARGGPARDGERHQPRRDASDPVLRRPERGTGGQHVVLRQLEHPPERAGVNRREGARRASRAARRVRRRTPPPPPRRHRGRT